MIEVEVKAKVPKEVKVEKKVAPEKAENGPMKTIFQQAFERMKQARDDKDKKDK